jgi:hypothetical protein
VPSPPSQLPPADSPSEEIVTYFQSTEIDAIVISHSCDLVEAHEKVSEVVLCAVWRCAEVPGHLATPKGMEDARRGNLPSYHMLAPCDLAGLESEVSVVDFRRVYSLPLSYVREFAATVGDRVRLLPPYREHLSQAFARFFMRVGLPLDIPPFR